jgi:two-component system sensor histidine kinase CreC
VNKRNRVFAGVLLAYLLGVGWLIWSLLGDIDPRYRESAEDSLVETSQLVATLVEQQLRAGGDIQREPLAALFTSLYARRFEAQIFAVRKTRVELRVVVVNAEGRVLFDSLGRVQGEDHADKREIARTLRGEYGARTSVDVDGDPNTSVMYVGAPIRIGSAIVGAVSVGKPVASLGAYVENARRKTLLVGLTASIAVLVLMLILSAWAVRPFGVVADYLRHVRQARGQQRLSLPRLGRSALGAIGAAYDEMRDALAGRNYVADYVQTLTHEVKSPLSAIRGAAELLQEPAMPEADRQRFVENIRRETGRIQELVDRMMELAEIEARRRLAALDEVRLPAMLDEVAASARAAAAARGVSVTLDVAPGAGDAIVEGDAFLLRRAVTNLVDNAIDFAPAGSTVSITLDGTPRTLEVRVRDRGPGIPAYATDKVFEKFYSLARPHSQKRSTGLGLSFVKEIAELHRARVTLANAGDGPGAEAVLALRRARG